MKRLSPDFKLSERGYANLSKLGAVAEFVDYEMDMFMSYFLDPELPDSKAKKSSWDMTCQRWMRSAWTGKAGRDWEYNRHKRDNYSSNGFKSISEAYAPDKPIPVRKYRVPTEEDSRAMFKQLEERMK